MKAEVTLDFSQIMQAAFTGVMRVVQNIKEGGRGTTLTSRKESLWENHIGGALGEAALAKAMDKFWLGLGIFGGADVGNLHVRLTAYDNGHLPLHEEDAGHYVMWLVTTTDWKLYKIRGWILAREGKIDSLWKPNGMGPNGRPAWFVPQSNLRSPDSYSEKATEKLVKEMSDGKPAEIARRPSSKTETFSDLLANDPGPTDF